MPPTGTNMPFNHIAQGKQWCQYTSICSMHNTLPARVQAHRRTNLGLVRPGMTLSQSHFLSFHSTLPPFYKFTIALNRQIYVYLLTLENTHFLFWINASYSAGLGQGAFPNKASAVNRNLQKSASFKTFLHASLWLWLFGFFFKFRSLKNIPFCRFLSLWYTLAVLNCKEKRTYNFICGRVYFGWWI